MLQTSPSPFLPLRIQEERNGHGMRIFSKLSADQLSAGKHIAPLIIAAELHVAAVLLIQRVEIKGLHDHGVRRR